MKRSYWILLSVLLLCAAPAGAADKTVGVVMSGNVRFYQEVHKAFVGTLSREGFDYRKVNTLMQMPSPDMMSWTNAARKFVVADINVLVTYGAPATLAAIKETDSIQIVYAGVYDPTAIGISAKNVTGISSKVPMTSLIKYAKKLMPFARLAVVYNDQEPDSVKQTEELSRLESEYGFQTVRMPIRKPDDANKLAFAGKADFVLISVSAVANESIDTILKIAHASKTPTMSQLPYSAEKGVILSLAPSAKEQGETAGMLTARMLRGENLAGTRPEVPKVVELVVNLKEASTIGLKVPIDLITDATEVIK